MPITIDLRAKLLDARDYTLHALVLLDMDVFEQHLTDQEKDRNTITRIETYAQLRRDIHRKVAQVQTDYNALLALCDRAIPPTQDRHRETAGADEAICHPVPTMPRTTPQPPTS